ncbi:hypothetical protein CPB83DRAFT_880434 [Crepidotus variabilis]|uniref:SET domain-containing protein n=1 Tax=Crepidotus variabilis TaxID=179855 RepID=A0A9P6EN19_9AGAR|nr:hypothetical protein CPB83DRAFT_880434 [Crepidotus variabilis]
MKRGFLLRAQEKKQKKISSTNAVKKGSGPDISEQDRKVPPNAIITPLSFGVVAEAEKTLPEDYKQFYSEPKYQEMHQDTVDFDHLMFTTIPQPEDGDGYSEWLVQDGKTKAKVVRAPGYPARIPKPRLVNMAIVKEVPDMGFGLFTSCDIMRGELIFAERPLLVSPRGFPTLDVPGYTQEQQRQLSMLQFEAHLKIALGRMSASKQKAFMALANNHTEDGSGPILGIIRTNGYMIDLGDDDDPDSVFNHYSAMGELASRINHSCQPNIKQEFDCASFSLQFYANRDLKAGEQLFYSYCYINTGVAERRAELAPHGVVCKCSSCVNATPASDKLRLTYIQESSKLHQLALANWKQGQKTDPKVFAAMLKLERDMINEGLHGEDPFYTLLVTIAGSYKFAGRPTMGDNYLKRCPAKVQGHLIHSLCL